MTAITSAPRGLAPLRALRAVVAALALALAACAPTLVAPYDQGIVDGLGAFQEDVYVLLDRAASEAPEADFADYEAEYRALGAQLDVLLTRAVVNAEGIDEAGRRAAERVNALLGASTGADAGAFEGLSLSASQIIDLRTLLDRTEAAHRAGEARSAGFWARRREQFTDAVATAMAQERFKQADGS